MVEFDFKKLIKPAVVVGGLVITVVSNMLSEKEQEEKIAKEVAKQLSKKEG